MTLKGWKIREEKGAKLYLCQASNQYTDRPVEIRKKRKEKEGLRLSVQQDTNEKRS